MGAERKATVTYTGDGTQTKYSFPFDYLRKAFVKVQDIAGDAITELTLGTDYSIDDKQVTLTKAIPSGNHLKIYRQTTTEPLVEWQDASVLRSADLSLQEVQLLHLSEETLDRVQEGGLSTDPNNSDVWDARFKRMKNLLDPKDDGDAMTLRYAKNTTNGMITNITNTGDTQVKRVTTTGDSQVKRVTDEGNTQNTRVTTTGDTYVAQMTSLKDTATTKATEASSSADLSKAWAVSKSSPDGTDSMSSLSWAEASRISAANAKTSETNAKASAAKAATSEASAETYMEHASASEVSAGDSAKAAKTSETNAATSATNAASSAESAKASAEAAKLYDPSVKQDKLTFDTTPTEGSINPVTSDGIKKAIDAKQNVLTFDTKPIAGSTNPVTSGGIKSAMDSVFNKSATIVPVTIVSKDGLTINQVHVQRAGAFVMVNFVGQVNWDSSYEKIKVAEGLPSPLFDYGYGKVDGVSMGSIDGSSYNVMFVVDTAGDLYLISRQQLAKNHKCFGNFVYLTNA